MFLFFLGLESFKFWEKKRKETQKSSPSWRLKEVEGGDRERESDCDA